jgi:hypothetical protein
MTPVGFLAVLEVGQGNRLADLEASHDIERKRQADIKTTCQVARGIVGLRLADPGLGTDGAFRQCQIARQHLRGGDVDDILRRLLFLFLAAPGRHDNQHQQEGPKK